MDSPEVTFTLAYVVFAVCFVFTPTEFHSAGLTVQNLLSGWLGSEDAAFVPYHLRRTAATLLCHSLLPLGCGGLGHHHPVMDRETGRLLRGHVLRSLRKAALLPQPGPGDLAGLPPAGIDTAHHRLHPDLLLVPGPVGPPPTGPHPGPLCPPAVRLAGRRFLRGHRVSADRQVCHGGAGCPCDCDRHVGDEGDHVPCARGPAAGRAPDCDGVPAARPLPRLEPARAAAYHPRGQCQPCCAGLRHPDLEACIGCMQTRASVRLVKTCQEADEGECQQCCCRPMWCLTCMGKWFASRQDPQRPDTWLASRVPCPTCRARFCILDVCAVR
ncbi:E3 ubiquitin-protein ligase TM129 isoform X2 [Tursiops truncatus]|uniref:E3 ubiquitin-protein ligase TM129 isoform X2 n=1 Tax=Tursiops truncatus TaxID=9739 RepID=A0A6J3REM4_TURTR|nr:E3 ubiquitin-protein ligase TM129 isoform X2 [Tursiops truncatus]